MPSYRVNNALKKTVYEVEYWNHPDHPDWNLQIETCWRYGEFVIHLQEGEEPPVNGQDGIEFEDYEEVECDHTWDGYYTDLNFNDKVPEDEQERLREGYYEDWSTFLEENGWQQDDYGAWITDEIEVSEEP